MNNSRRTWLAYGPVLMGLMAVMVAFMNVPSQTKPTNLGNEVGLFQPPPPTVTNTLTPTVTSTATNTPTRTNTPPPTQIPTGIPVPTQKGNTRFTITQLITQGFPTQSLPTDGSTYVTLLQIPFTVKQSGMVQVTNLMSFSVDSGGYGAGGSLVCNLKIDGTQFVSKTYHTIAGSVDVDGSVTATQAVSPGAHVIALACTSSTFGYPVHVDSHGTSLIIVD